ncbi:hypothetical protein LX73_0608 [Fodinibius salinus]|uniref:Tetratricopeptide repeat-containing protein n=1 Tax=Fodinibius salinus TaxID=860790 RepID=A0A5D3YN23_9BACT|nr:hypothetical protein [Fodinibius salinus]TYP95310.1 hypothetical protein LX73_0608 [Fodinibius salinus]
MAVFEQDFLMRQVQYLTQLLQQIIFKKNNNKQSEAIREIENAFQRLTKEQPQKLNELSLEETIALFRHQGDFKSDLALAVADLLIEEAQMLSDKNYSRSQKAYQQALLLFKKTQNTASSAIPVNMEEKISVAENNITNSEQLNLIDQLTDEDG